MKVKPLVFAIYVTLGFSLGGCINIGGSSDKTDTTQSNDEPSVPSVTLQGTAADGLLEGAKICLDENENWQCDTGEPQTETKADGKYQLKVENKTVDDIENLNVIVEAGVKTEGNETGAFLVLVRQVDDATRPQDVTPITTMLAQGVTEEELKTIIGADAADIDLRSARVVLENPVVKDYALSIAKVLAAKLEQASNTQAIGEVVKAATQEMATQLKSQTTPVAANELAQKLQQVQVEVVSDKLTDVVVAVQARDEKGNPLKNAQVEVRLVNEQGQILKADNGQEVVRAQTDASGRVLVRLPAYSQDEKLPKDDKNSVYATAQVKVLRKGYAPVERVIRNVRLGDSLTVRAALAAMPVKSVRVSATLQFNGAFVASEQPLVFALVSKGGEKRVLAGQEALAQAEGDADVVLKLPPDWIDTAKVTAVTAAIRGFNAAEKKEVQAFPGEFKGVGQPSKEQASGVDFNLAEREAQAQVGEEVQLVSGAFARIELTDQNGEPLQFAPVQAASESDPISVYLKIPEDAYGLVTEKGDQSTSEAGWQIPIYVFDGYQWKYAGLGTVVIYDPVVGAYQSASLENGFDGDKAYYAEINITQATQWLEWLNLDWPIMLDAPKPLTGSVVYEGDTPVPYTGGAWLVKNAQWDWIWVEEGAIQNVERPAESLESAELVVYNDRFNYVEQRAPIQQNGDEFNVQLVLQNPYRCKIQGVVAKQQGDATYPLSGVYVSATSDTTGYYQEGYTNPAGEISISAPCNEHVTLNVNGQPLSFNVDGQKTGSETSDDGKAVQFNLTQQNTKPYLWTSTNVAHLKLAEGESKTFTLYADAYDVDDDEVTLSLTCPEGTEALASAAYAYASKQLTCQVNQSVFAENEVSKHLTATATAIDASGGTEEQAVSILVEKILSNNPPVVLGLERNGILIPCEFSQNAYVCNDTVRASVGSVAYTINAYDPDGDALLYNGNENGQVTLQVPQAGTSQSTISITDQPETGEPKTVTVNVALTGQQNTPPVVLAAVDPAKVKAGENARLTILVEDDVDLPSNVLPTVTVDDAELSGISPVAGGQWQVNLPTDSVGAHQVKVTFTDADNATGEYQLSYEVIGNQPPEVAITASPDVVNAGELLTVTFSATDDGDLGTAQARLSLLNANGEEVDYTEKMGLQPFDTLSLTMPATGIPSGTYRLHLEVTDEEGAKGRDEKSITLKVQNSIQINVD